MQARLYVDIGVYVVYYRRVAGCGLRAAALGFGMVRVALERRVSYLKAAKLPKATYVVKS